MLEKERADIATGEVRREHWYLPTSPSSQQCAPKELLWLIRNHWEVENSLHHLKDRVPRRNNSLFRPSRIEAKPS